MPISSNDTQQAAADYRKLVALAQDPDDAHRLTGTRVFADADGVHMGVGGPHGFVDVTFMPDGVRYTNVVPVSTALTPRLDADQAARVRRVLDAAGVTA